MQEIISFEERSLFWTDEVIIAGFLAEKLTGHFDKKYTRISLRTITALNLLLTGRIITFAEISHHCASIGVIPTNPNKYAQLLISRVRQAVEILGCNIDTVFGAGYILPRTDLHYLRKCIFDYAENNIISEKQHTSLAPVQSNVHDTDQKFTGRPSIFRRYDFEELIKNICTLVGDDKAISLRHTRVLALLSALSTGYIVTHDEIWSFRGIEYSSRVTTRPDHKSVYAGNLVCRARRILRPLNIDIKTLHEVGYAVDESDAVKIQSLFYEGE